MSPEIWAAIVGSLVLVAATGVGVVTWSHVQNAQKTASEAIGKAHNIETEFLKYQAQAERRFVSHDRLDDLFALLIKQLDEINRKLDGKADRNQGGVQHA